MEYSCDFPFFATEPGCDNICYKSLQMNTIDSLQIKSWRV